MPDWKAEVRSRLRGLRLAPERETEIVEELAQHLEDRWRDLVSGGVAPDEAARLAIADFRSDTLSRYMAPLRQAQVPLPATPAAPAGSLLPGVWHDLRYGVRVFFKQPGYAAAAVLTLALGIGATTAMFSVVRGVLLKPLPFDEPERLVSVYHSAPGINTPVVYHGPATYLTYRDNQRTFAELGAWERGEVSVTGTGEPEQVEALAVTASMMEVLRLRPALGRLLDAADDAPAAPLRGLLTHAYWQRRFAGAAGVIGQPLTVDGQVLEVIGVLPPSFEFLNADPALVVPMQLDEANAPRGIMFDFQAVARLKPGTSLAQATADVGRMISMLPPDFATLALQPRIRPLTDEVIGDIARMLWILLAAVGVVLLVACANVANLFLVRSESRHQEFAVRAALGASRSRIARVLLTESLVLALAAGAVGVLLASASIDLLHQLAPAELPRADEIAIDPVVLLFTVVISLAAGAVFGLVPALRLGTISAAALKDGGRSASDTPGRRRTRDALVVAEVALALTLLIVSGLMVRTFLTLQRIDPGFTDPQTVQTFRLAVPDRLIDDPEEVARTYQNIAQHIAALPGVDAVGISSSITMDGEDNTNPLWVEGVQVPEGVMPPLRRFKSAAPGYFETIGNHIAAGRPFTWSDIYERRPVVVISENLAREFWGGAQQALGRRVRPNPNSAWREVVGVVGNAHDDGLNRPATAIVYWPMLDERYPQRSMSFAVRSDRAGTSAFVRELQQAVWAVNPNLPLAAIQTLADLRAASMAQTSFAMVLLVLAASVALLLGMVGIFSVMSYAAAQRTREIGIRMALGAQIADVWRMFLRQGLRLIAIGLALGVVTALVITRVMGSLLFGVGPADPATYAIVSTALAAAALLAAYLPARKAARLDPLVALRSDT
jgi:predicted permease